MSQRVPWVCAILLLLLVSLTAVVRSEPMTTWDGKHDISSIAVTMVYFVPKDRTPLPDWRERVDYFARRIEKFHSREYQGQSKLHAIVRDEPFRSARTTAQLRAGDANATFSMTLREVERAVDFADKTDGSFPILLVLSDINWRPLEDFYRVRPTGEGFEFEGQFIQGRHFPGATSGGSRATYHADRGVGWGLVSADGWRVPYCGTDCVIYHEGLGHPVGLPHPEPPNGSVMSAAQYQGWLSDSWIDDDQKKRLGWKEDKPVSRSDLFSTFRALPEPLVPRPQQDVALKLEWPAEVGRLTSLRVRIQTELFGPWIEPAETVSLSGEPPSMVSIGRFDRPTPVCYRVDVQLEDGQTEELWGYFQVRSQPDKPLLPRTIDVANLAIADLAPAPQIRSTRGSAETVDLIALVDPSRDGISGKWSLSDKRLESPKAYGARLELPYEPGEDYELTVVAEALDEPNGLILGQRMGQNRFLVLLNFQQQDGEPASALENVNGLNVKNNATTYRARLFERERPFQVVCTVREKSVVVTCDGHQVIRWEGDPGELSLADYWKTPTESALFVGAYDCRYRFHRITLVPLSGQGKVLTK